MKDFSRFIYVLTKIKDISRPGIFLFKFKDFSGFQGPVGTMSAPPRLRDVINPLMGFRDLLWE